MYIPSLLHTLNDAICFLIGVPLNVLLIWIVVAWSPKDMTNYGPILLLSAVIDIVYLVVYCFVVPVTIVMDGRGAIFSLGPLCNAAQPWNFVLVELYIFFHLFSQYTLSVPFVYRYFILCRDKEWGVRVFLAMLLVPTCFCFNQLYWTYFGGYTEDLYAANAFFQFTGNYSVPIFSLSQEQNNYIAAPIMMVASVNYMLIFTISWLIHRYLSRMAIANHSVQDRIRTMNKQVSKALLLQALIPFTVEFLPTLSLGVAAVFNFTLLGDLSVYVNVIIAWIPVLDPLVTMWVVTVYHKQLEKWLGILLRFVSGKGNNDVASVHVTPAVAPPPAMLENQHH